MRPKVKVFERKKVHFTGGSPYGPGEGFYAEISHESEIRVGEQPNEAVQRALSELQEMITTQPPGTARSPTVAPDSLEERIRKATAGK